MMEIDVETRRKAVATEPAKPAHYLVLGDFGGRPAAPSAIDRDNFDSVLASVGLNLQGILVHELEDFHPDRLYQRLDLFRGLREAKPEPVEAPRPKPAPRPDIGEIIRPSSLLDQIVEGEGDPLQQYLRELTQAHAAPQAQPAPQRVSALCERMRHVLRVLRPLESNWRGLDFVLRRMDDQSAKIHIAHFSKKDVSADLSATGNLRSTRTYSLFHAREWQGIFGLYSFGGDPEETASDIELLGRIALLAAHARAPFIAEGSADMGPNWEELRGIPESGSIGLALPRFLLRLPYGARTSPIESFEFEEMPAMPVHSDYVWGNPAFACLAALTGAPNEDADAGEPDGLNLSGFPLHTYQEGGEWKSTPCAEVLLTEAQVSALLDLGMIPLISFRDSDRVRLAGFRAINGKALSLGR